MSKRRAADAAGLKRKRLAKEFPGFSSTLGHCFVLGTNGFGALGLGREVQVKGRPAFVDVDGKKLLSVVCGGMHTVALAEDGTVYTWGVNDEGALGRPTTEATCWEEEPEDRKGDPYIPGKAQLPEAVSVVQIVAGDGFTFALTDDGCVYGWGQFRDDVCSMKQFSASVKLQKLPALVYKPPAAASARDLAPKLDRVCKLAAGASHMAALTRRGAVLTWGFGAQGQLGRLEPYYVDSPQPSLQKLLTPTQVPGVAAAVGSDIADIGCGSYTTYAITKRGAVAAWGLNNSGQLGLPVIVEQRPQQQDGEPAEAAAADGQQDGEQKQAERVDHGVWEPTAVPGLEKGIAAVVGGEQHTLVLSKQHKVLCFGRREYGVLGREEGLPPGDAPISDPIEVEGSDGLADEKATGIAAGMNVSACVTSQGNAFLWGSNTNLQMAKGVEDDDDNTVPRRMRRTAAFGHRQVLQFSFGGQHAALLASEDPAVVAAEAAAAATAAAATGAGTPAEPEVAQPAAANGPADACTSADAGEAAAAAGKSKRGRKGAAAAGEEAAAAPKGKRSRQAAAAKDGEAEQQEDEAAAGPSKAPASKRRKH